MVSSSIGRQDSSHAPVGQTSVQRPHAVQRLRSTVWPRSSTVCAAFGQAAAHAPQPKQSCAVYSSCGRRLCVSGL